jgi:hypothetical protein
MVERTNNFESKEIHQQRLSSLSSTHCRILSRMIPSFGEVNFPHFTSAYLAGILRINSAYLEEILEFLVDKGIVSSDGEDYYLSQDNIWSIQDIIKVQPAVILKVKLDEFAGEGG